MSKIELNKKGKVRRAKLYYLRDRRGKSARIVEKIQVSKKDSKTQVDENNSEELDGCWEKDDAIARIMGDKALFSRVCDLYSRSAPDKLKLLQQAVDSRDFEKVQVLSLKLKGMSADIGAVQLQRDFESLWELSKAKKWEDAEALLPSITDDLNTFLEILEVA